MGLSEIAAELYGLDPGEFVAARKDRAAQAKRAGDGDLAAAVAELRKPTVAAWTVNLLAREAPDEVDALLRLGEALREAQRELSGDDLRTLTRQRQQVVNALARRAGELAAEHDHPVGEPVLREVATTLTAALADPGVADQVRDGTLAKAASYEGFGDAAPALTAVPEADSGTRRRDRARTAGRQGKTRERSRADRAAEQRKAAEAELFEARGAAETARAEQDSAERDAVEAERRLREADELVGRLRAELTAAEEQHRFARTAERAAREAARAAATELERAQRSVERAEQALADHESGG
ncbi:hypothetical protein IU510_22595 [Nocardia cyriacigeorgica]|uniref:hypothetical protein n=1 Tax=Nocardia cyriacigeorgica TaxID=135487 RepID=UPI001892FCB6|nr:hypothetical protein [Nocardia cyriacigeorgica]MBF6100844.1 hypothetical protein [Nocardia cyriacigeorgica]MBF6161758.1 hypothetical protein [Nocardia cyriacigeorgica]MBF6200556.1 hypothetical protein [Nocardia cyriacigeorgica]